MHPSWLFSLLDREIVERIDQDPRTVATPNSFLGWAKDKVYSDVICGGQADFDAGIGHLSGLDSALLYARYNQPRHLDELASAFRTLFETSEHVDHPTLLDIGCGPFTSGLAFAGQFGNRPFRYYGIDRAGAMLELGGRLADAARAAGGLHPDSEIFFGKDYGFDFGQVTQNLTVVVISYLFASPSLDVGQLVDDLLGMLKRIGPGPVAVLYTNSAYPHLNRKFPEFSDRLQAAGFTVHVDDKAYFIETKTPKDMRYALFFRPNQLTVQL